MSSQGGNRRRWIGLIVGILLSAGALALALRKTSLDQIGDALNQIELIWLLPMVVVKALVLVVKDVRWRIELRAMERRDYRRTFRAIGLGYFGNILLPFKLGELLRVGLLKRHNPEVGVGHALATVAAERALDGVVLAAMVAIALPTATVPPWVERGTIILLAAMLAVVVVSMVRPVHEFFLRVLPRRGLFAIARKVITALSEGTAVVRSPRALALAVATTALGWLGEALVLFCAVQAMSLALDIQSSLVVTLLLSIGLLIPTAPGQIGTHQALTVLFLTPFGVAASHAVAVSVVLQIVALSTLGSIGGYVLIREAGARDLVRDAQRPDGTGES